MRSHNELVNDFKRLCTLKKINETSNWKRSLLNGQIRINISKMEYDHILSYLINNIMNEDRNV